VLNVVELEEFQKKELILGVNSFDQPSEVSGVNAWVKLITHLLFLQKGSFPSDPLMGIGIQTYDYRAIDDIAEDLQEDITIQIKTYLPDITFESAIVDKTVTPNGQTLLLVILNFEVEDGELETVAVAADTSKNIINFECRKKKRNC